MVKPLTFAQKVKSLIIVGVGGASVCAGFGFYQENENLYRKILMPSAHFFSGEVSHRLGVIACKYGIFPKNNYKDPESLNTTFIGKQINNPIGMAAGFDKNAEAVLGINKIGFGFAEIGSVTPKPQEGSAKPRVFRLPEDKAIINRYGFNNHGHDVVYDRLKYLRKEKKYKGVIGVNLGRNRITDDPIEDYNMGIRKFADVADYYVINISSPNTPGLTDIQKNKNNLKNILSSVIKVRNSLSEEYRHPIFVKLSPDLSTNNKKVIAEVIQRPECQVDGIIVCNTTVERPDTLKNENAKEVGGLSGPPIKDNSTNMIAEMYNLTNGMTIIGVGGISSGQDAYDKIKAGATYVQLYTSFVYQGPPVATKIRKELKELVEKDGYKHYTEAIGKENGVNKHYS